MDGVEEIEWSCNSSSEEELLKTSSQKIAFLEGSVWTAFISFNSSTFILEEEELWLEKALKNALLNKAVSIVEFDVLGEVGVRGKVDVCDWGEAGGRGKVDCEVEDCVVDGREEIGVCENNVEIVKISNFQMSYYWLISTEVFFLKRFLNGFKGEEMERKQLKVVEMRIRKMFDEGNFFCFSWRLHSLKTKFCHKIIF